MYVSSSPELEIQEVVSRLRGVLGMFLTAELSLQLLLC